MKIMDKKTDVEYLKIIFEMFFSKKLIYLTSYNDEIIG